MVDGDARGGAPLTVCALDGLTVSASFCEDIDPSFAEIKISPFNGNFIFQPLAVSFLPRKRAQQISLRLCPYLRMMF